MEKIVKGRAIEWELVYDKDGISIYRDPIFTRVKLVTSKGEAIAKDVVAVNGIVAFSDYYEGGIGKIKAYIPYFPVTALNIPDK